MPLRFRSHLIPAAVVALFAAAPASAQKKDSVPPPPTCNPNAIPTPRLAKATLALQRAFMALQPGSDTTQLPKPKRGEKVLPPDPVRDLKQTITFLTEPLDKKQKELGDSLGRDYYLGQAYLVLLEQPGIKPIGRRGDFGIATDTSLTIDLLAAADTILTRVEQNMPLCRAEVARWRQQKPWVLALNGSINALNAGQYDSAEALAKRSLIIERGAPYAYTVLASIANNRKDFDTSTQMYKKVIEISEKDSAYAAEGMGARYDLANTATMRAEAASAGDKTALTRDAIKAWQEYIPLGGRDVQVASAVQLIRKLLKSINDTTSYQQAYAAIIANPAKFGEATLLNSGLIATQAKRPDDAVKLFSASLDQNPYQRDALNNLAASYAATKQPEKMLPLIERLVTLDPNNADNWLLYAYAYSGLIKGTKDTKLIKEYTDSLVKYNNKAEQLSPRLTLAAFSHTPTETTLSGSLEHYVPKVVSVSGKTMNKTTKSPPKTYTLVVDFLDAKGTVLGTETVSVGPVAQGSVEPFNVTLKGKDAVAFRYKPIE